MITITSGGISDSELNDKVLADLLATPREDLAIEFKDWLDLSDKIQQADLAKAMMAMANHGGGIVVIGFRHENKHRLVEREKPADIQARHYSPDDVSGIVKRYADPSFLVQVRHVKHPITGLEHPIITVNSGCATPIRAKADDPERKHVKVNQYYIRALGPASKPAETADEWNTLISRCVRHNREQLVDSIRHVMVGWTPSRPSSYQDELTNWIAANIALFEQERQIELPNASQKQLTDNYVVFAYGIEGTFNAPEPRGLLEILDNIQRREPGGPYWLVQFPGGVPEPRITDDNRALVCWRDVFQQPAGYWVNFELWKASLGGMMFLLQGYHEDVNPSGIKPGTKLRESQPVDNVAIVLSHAARLAKALGGQDATIHCRVEWHGLKGRELGLSYSRDTLAGPPTCSQSTVTSGPWPVTVSEIEAVLPELVAKITEPIYTAFTFHRLGEGYVGKIVENLKMRVPRLWEA